MGAIFSNLKDIEHNSNLIKFFDEDEISPPDPFWNQFLSFSYIPDYSILENDSILNQLSVLLKCHFRNHFNTRNVYNLIQVFLIRSDELKKSTECTSILSKDSIFLKQIYNGLFIIRYLLKIFLEIDKIPYLFENEFMNENRCILRNLLVSLLSLAIEIPVNKATYFVHMEIILILNVILNCDMYTSNGYLLQDFLFENECTLHSRTLIKYLLGNIVSVDSTNSLNRLDHGISTNKENAYIGNNLWRLISFGYFTNQNNANNNNTIDCLSSECVFLILKLCFHSKAKDCYKKSLFALLDPTLKDSEALRGKDYSSDSTLEISFSILLTAISSNFEEEHFVLLFYLLIHRNMSFRNYVLSLENFKNIILPLIKLIYNYSSENSNVVYMALIILLIMTENSYFNSSIHRENVDYLYWIKEKTITNMSVGSLIVWILCRTIQFNFGYIGDRYIHINCLAALANMSSKFLNLHPQASEQIMILLNILQKRKTCVSNNLKDLNETRDVERFSNLSNNLSIIEEVLQMLVEIINTALIFSLNNNPHMIHTFLYHRKQFSQLKQYSHTQSHACNIDAILTFFSSKIEKELGKSVSSQNEVLKVIKKFSPSINKLNNFKRFPELKFKYIEQESSDEFFVPYIWKLICKKSRIHFKEKNDNSSNHYNC